MKSIPTLIQPLRKIRNVQSLKRAPHLLILKWVCHLICLTLLLAYVGQHPLDMNLPHSGTKAKTSKPNNVTSGGVAKG